MPNISTTRGAIVTYSGEQMKVVGANGFDSVTLKSNSGDYLQAPVDALVEEAAGKIKKARLDPKRLDKVEAYRLALAPLLDPGKKRTRHDVRHAGQTLGISIASAYNALARYDATGDINDLPPPTRPGGRGKSRLPAKAEAIIEEKVEEILLNRRQRRIKYFLTETTKALTKAGFEVSDGTLRNRVAAIPPYEWTKKRKGYDTAKKTLDPHRGDAPTGTRPLEIVQCDHWKTDVEILSNDRLTIIGRAWLTLGIDVYSRVVWGWHLGLDSPGMTPTGFCMINGMTRKDGALKAHDLAAKMPFYGKPEALHLDNAGEFRGKTMAAACKHFSITLKWRPVRSPQYGAHIERLNQTLAQMFKDLPGATGSTATERKALRPAMTAALTFEDLEKQLLMMFDQYHNTPHIGIGGKTPMQRWTEFYFGPEGQRRKTPDIVLDDLSLRVNWYPLETRTLQRYGIKLSHLDYYSEDLEHLVRNRKEHGRVQIRRDPLDVRRIFLFHPVRQEWLIVPCRQLTFPVATILELRDARKTALKLKRAPTAEALAQIIDDRHRHAEQAEKKTKSAARAATSKANSERMRKKVPKTFGDVADDDRIEILESEPVNRIATKVPATKPSSVSSRSTKSQRPQETGSFVGSAASIAAVSDAEIDEYLDGK